MFFYPGTNPFPACAHPTRSNAVRPFPIALNAEGVMPVSFLNCALRWATLLKPVRKAISLMVSSS